MNRCELSAALSVAIASVVTALSLAAQAIPPPSQAREALQQAIQQQPGLADVIRSRIRQSGMSAEQVRARLQASGYAQNLLDAYLGSATPGQAEGVIEFPIGQESGVTGDRGPVEL